MARSTSSTTRARPRHGDAPSHEGVVASSNWRAPQLRSRGPTTQRTEVVARPPGDGRRRGLRKARSASTLLLSRRSSPRDSLRHHQRPVRSRRDDWPRSPPLSSPEAHTAATPYIPTMAPTTARPRRRDGGRSARHEGSMSARTRRCESPLKRASCPRGPHRGETASAARAAEGPRREHGVALALKAPTRRWSSCSSPPCPRLTNAMN